MKRILMIVFAAVLLLCAVPIAISAEAGAQPSVDVTVSIINVNPVMKAESVTVADIDGDGIISISDALYCAHEKRFDGGAEEGYTAEATSFGLSLTKLWGVTNNGCFGYYLNNAATLSLSDEIKNGDYICAFVMTDTINWSDKYSYFDKNSATVDAGAELTLTLSYLDNWGTTIVPAENITITVDGKDTAFKTNKDGNVTLTITEAGTHTVSAFSLDPNLVPPVCVVNVNAPKTDYKPMNLGWLIPVCAAVAISAVAVAVALSQKKSKKK